MKHLHFVQSLEPLEGGGLGRAAHDLHEALLSTEHSSVLVATTGNGCVSSCANTYEYPRRGPAKAFFSPRLMAEARPLARESHVVHGHGFYVFPNWILGSVARRFEKSLVYHPHGMFEPWILNRSRWKKKVAHLLFENRNFSSARLWRALTEKEAAQIRDQGISAPIVVAPNGIHIEPFDAVEEPPEGEKKRILFLGRLHPKKGLDLLVRSWAKQQSRHPDWELLIAGPDEGGYRRSIEQLVKTCDCAKSVRFIEAVTGEEKVRLIKSADLFVLTSYSEGFSVAILEALACWKPVLATTACNFPELATDGGGWECPPEQEATDKALAEALDCGESERKERGSAGRRLLEQKYTWKSIAKTIAEASEQYCI